MYIVSFLKGIFLGGAFENNHLIEPIAYFFLSLDKEYSDREVY